MKASNLEIGSTDARNSAYEGIFGEFSDVIKQRRQSFVINDRSAEGIFLIGKRSQTNEIIPIIASEK